MHRLEIILQDGDFIFQDLDCDICEAIEGVTDGYDDYNFSHVGIVKRSGDSVLIGEAISKGVVWTPLSNFASRAEKEGIPQLLVMRLKPPYQKHIEPALEFIENREGADYDPEYVYGDDRYYCSELLHDAFARSTPTLFTLEPMTFKTPDGQAFHPAWIDYFQSRDLQIPEGKAGINPGGMSTSPHLEPIFVMGLN
jgi:hypothetical protein